MCSLSSYIRIFLLLRLFNSVVSQGVGTAGYGIFGILHEKGEGEYRRLEHPTSLLPYKMVGAQGTDTTLQSYCRHALKDMQTRFV